MIQSFACSDFAVAPVTLGFRGYDPYIDYMTHYMTEFVSHNRVSKHNKMP